MHLYNSTSTVQREVRCFGLDRAGIVAIAVEGRAPSSAQARARLPDTEWTFEYSPESFTGTELDYAVEDLRRRDRRRGSRRPATTLHPESAGDGRDGTPNIYADQIEWFGRHVSSGATR